MAEREAGGEAKAPLYPNNIKLVLTALADPTLHQKQAQFLVFFFQHRGSIKPIFLKKNILIPLNLL